MRKVKVFSPTNIALAKYWGKRDPTLNLPANSSLSVTLADFGSETEVVFDSRFKKDVFILNGKEIPGSRVKPGMTRWERILNILRDLKKEKVYAQVTSFNNFPTAAGLASSASGMSALTLAGAKALELDLSKEKLSHISRLGSGSSCRSFWGGFVEWKKGEKEDGSDCEAFQIAPHSHWNLHCVILVIQEHEKLVSSTEGMKHAEKTSPYFLKWSEEAEKDYLEIKKFVLEKDFEMLSKTVEANCLKMHKTCLTSIPPTLYWSGKTLEILDKIRDWQRGGLRAFFTIDAGPNVVIFCEESSKDSLFELASKLPYVSPLLTKIGTGPVYF